MSPDRRRFRLDSSVECFNLTVRAIVPQLIGAVKTRIDFLPCRAFFAAIHTNRGRILEVVAFVPAVYGMGHHPESHRQIRQVRGRKRHTGWLWQFRRCWLSHPRWCATIRTGDVATCATTLITGRGRTAHRPLAHSWALAVVVRAAADSMAARIRIRCMVSLRSEMEVGGGYRPEKSLERELQP